jgi:hypothetical protein
MAARLSCRHRFSCSARTIVRRRRSSVFRDVDAHPARFVEQRGVDEQVDGALLDQAIAHRHRRFRGSMRKTHAHEPLMKRAQLSS